MRCGTRWRRPCSTGGVPLPTIGAVLGHAGTSTTEVYLSIDEPRLAELALEVPDVGRA